MRPAVFYWRGGMSVGLTDKDLKNDFIAEGIDEPILGDATPLM